MSEPISRVDTGRGGEFKEGTVVERKDEEGNVFGVLETHYDKAGRVARELERRDDGALVEERKYEYDSTGRKIQEIRENDKGEVFGATDYTYDEAGRLKKKHSWIEVFSLDIYEENPDTFYTTEEFVYDDAGKLIDTKVARSENIAGRDVKK